MDHEQAASPREQSFNIRKIAVPVDFSEPAQRALECAVVMARQFGAVVQLIHVMPPLPLPAPPSDGTAVVPLTVNAPELGERRKAAQHKLERLEKLCSARGVNAQRVITDSAANSPHLTIVETAKKHAADLIVMGTHGRSGLERLLLGSVAEGVVRHSGIPVVCVPPPDSDYN